MTILQEEGIGEWEVFDSEEEYEQWGKDQEEKQNQTILSYLMGPNVNYNLAGK